MCTQDNLMQLTNNHLFNLKYITSHINKLIKMGAIILSIITLGACGAKTMTTNTTFDWLPSEGGPNNYPMKVISGTFHYKDGGGAYVPSGALLYHMWGKYRSTHVSGPGLKPIPHKLSITFFSYTENKFYQGDFDLPYDEILTLFQQGYYSTKAQGVTRYDTIVAGISPGGGVAVWLNGLNRNTQVFYGKAKEVELNWEVMEIEDEVRDDYVKEIVEESIPAEDYKKLVTEGVPLERWDNYQHRYHWQLNLLTENRAPKLVEEISYVNGEVDYFFYPLSEDIAKQTRAVPKFLYYSWKTPEGKPLDLHYTFDVDEITAVFKDFEAKKPTTADEPILLSLYLWENKDGRRWGVAVQRGDEETVLKKVKLKQYRSNSELDDADAFYQDEQ
jgi:hypothetical protein